jgi:endoglucanase
MGNRLRAFVRCAATVLAAVLVVGGTIVAAPAAHAAPTAVAGSAPIPGWLHTAGGTIRTEGNAAHVIKGAAWFGMETSNCAPHGLWSIGLQAGLAQIKGMGFNTIRLPFSNECLAATSTNSINFALNPTLQGKTPLQVMDTVIATAKANGLSVILDRHRPDSASQSQLWYTGQYSEARWVSDWKMLASRYKSEPAVIGFDLHNEPHGSACWGCGDAATDWQAAATRAGNAVLAVNPKLLIIVEGVEKHAGNSTWWGGSLAGVKAKPVTLSVANRVVYSPHDYPASIYPQNWFAAANYPNNLPGVWDANWGYIAKSGIAPVLLGEFGTKLETTSDKQWLASMVGYLKNTQMSFAYWSFNPNSGDTGGLVKDDWVTPQKEKLAALAPLIGSGAAVPVPTPTTPAPTPKPTITATPKPTASPKPTATPKPKPTATPKPTASATPKPTATTTPKPTATPQPAGGAVSARWILQNSWATGYVANFEVTSQAGARGWTVTWADPSVTGIASAWGMTCTVKQKVSVTCAGSDWAASLAVGQTHHVGLQVNATQAPQSPKLTVTAR